MTRFTAQQGAMLRSSTLTAALMTLAVVLSVGLSTAPAIAKTATSESTLPAETISDIAYTDPVPPTTNGNLLDIHLPERTAGEPVPLFIFTEGSAWFADTGKSSGGAWAQRLNPAGYAVAGVSVRSSFQAQFPAQLHDIKSAIRYLRFHADEYGIDPDRIAIGGFSSGAWAAAMAGTTGDVEDLEGTQGVTGVSSRVQAAVTLSAPTAFLLMDEQATEFSSLVHDVPGSPESFMTGCSSILGGPGSIGHPDCENAELANPLNYATVDDPPFLIFHGTHDPLLPPAQSEVLFEALTDVCVDAELSLIDGVDHQYGYLTDPVGPDPDEPLVQGQTVHKVNTSTCSTSTTTVSPEQSVPSYDQIIAFLDRALVPTWDASAVYIEGDRVNHDGRQYEAQWWTRNQVPGASPYSAWAEVAEATVCSDGPHRSWAASTIYTGGETVADGGSLWTAKWWTRNQAPGASPWGPWENAGSC